MILKSKKDPESVKKIHELLLNVPLFMETRAFLEVICHSLLQYELQMLEFQAGFSQFFQDRKVTVIS